MGATIDMFATMQRTASNLGLTLAIGKTLELRKISDDRLVCDGSHLEVAKVIHALAEAEVALREWLANNAGKGVK